MEESKGGGEVRKIHIVYFLCHNGKIDQPHLIKVNRRSNHGIRLRDVKRWLSELRGEDLPEYFAWSYKRRYRGGYVWQDLIDDELITAISDSEYVLKGSLLPSLAMEAFFDGEKSPIKQGTEEREKLQIDGKILSSEETESKDRFFRVGSIWLKEAERGEEEKRSVIVVKKKKKIESESNSNRRKSTNAMRNFIGCMKVETKGTAQRVAQRGRVNLLYAVFTKAAIHTLRI